MPRLSASTATTGTAKVRSSSCIQRDIPRNDGGCGRGCQPEVPGLFRTGTTTTPASGSSRTLTVAP
jgi:hypothetical protein